MFELNIPTGYQWREGELVPVRFGLGRQLLRFLVTTIFQEGFMSSTKDFNAVTATLFEKEEHFQKWWKRNLNATPEHTYLGVVGCMQSVASYVFFEGFELSHRHFNGDSSLETLEEGRAFLEDYLETAITLVTSQPTRSDLEEKDYGTETCCNCRGKLQS